MTNAPSRSQPVVISKREVPISASSLHNNTFNHYSNSSRVAAKIFQLCDAPDLATGYNLVESNADTGTILILLATPAESGPLLRVLLFGCEYFIRAF